MQTELPTMLNVFEADYQLEYSDSYSGTIIETIIEGYKYCNSLQRAFESLISDGYNSNFTTISKIKCHKVFCYSISCDPLTRKSSLSYLIFR